MGSSPRQDWLLLDLAFAFFGEAPEVAHADDKTCYTSVFGHVHFATHSKLCNSAFLDRIY